MPDSTTVVADDLLDPLGIGAGGGDVTELLATADKRIAKERREVKRLLARRAKLFRQLRAGGPAHLRAELLDVDNRLRELGVLDR